MTFVGKLLVVINLAMSVCFMGFAVSVYTARENVKAKLDKQGQELAAAKKAKQEAETLQADLQTKLEAEKKQLEETKQTLAGDVERLTQQSQQLDAQLKAAQEDVTKANAARQSATIEQKQRKTETDELVQTRDRLLNDNSQLVSIKTTLQDELAQTKNDLEITTARLSEVTTRLDQYHAWIVRRNDGIMPTESQLEDQGDLPPTPDVEGKVTQVDETGRYIQLSIGSDDGVREGHEFVVWRTSPDAKFVGKVKVFTVQATTAVAQPLNSRGLILKNDSVGPRIR